MKYKCDRCWNDASECELCGQWHTSNYRFKCEKCHKVLCSAQVTTDYCPTDWQYRHTTKTNMCGKAIPIPEELPMQTKECRGCGRIISVDTPECNPKISPSPEARVDWESVAQGILIELQKYCDCPEGWPKKKEIIASALSTAFKKGQEAR